MTFFKAVALALAATSALAAESVKAPVVPGTYIVEFSAGQADTVSNTLQSALMDFPEALDKYSLSPSRPSSATSQPTRLTQHLA
jgi:hypothetical protein